MTLHIRHQGFAPASIRHPFTYEYLIAGAVAAVFEGTAIIGPCDYDADDWTIEAIEIDAIASGAESSRPLATTVAVPTSHVLYDLFAEHIHGPARAEIDREWAATWPTVTRRAA